MRNRSSRIVPRRVLVPVIPCLALVFTLAVPAPAQYAPGDVVVVDLRPNASAGRLWGLRPSGVLYTVTASLPFDPRVLMTAPDNRSLWISGVKNQTFVLVQMAPDGALTTLYSGANVFVAGMDVDGGGNVIVTNGTRLEVLRYAASRFTTLATVAWTSNGHAGGLDLASGDFVFEDVLGVSLMRCRLYPTPAISRVLSITRPGAAVGIHADPPTGDLLVGWTYYRGTFGGIYRLTLGPPPALQTLAAGSPWSMIGGFDRDPKDGQLVVPSDATALSSLPDALYRFDPKTRAITTLTVFPISAGARPWQVVVAGSRHLSAGADARPGQPYPLLVSAPRDPGAAYAIALSFGFRPGIPVGGGRKVDLAPDPLFFLSQANPLLFRGFQGVLNAQGEARATVSIPPIPALRGVRFFAAAITVKRGQVATVSETLGATIR